MSTETKINVRKVQTLDVPLDTRPGQLAEIYLALKQSGVSVKASWGYEMGPEKGMVHIFTEEKAAAEKVLKSLHKDFSTGNACWAEGFDDLGAYAALLQKIATAGINLNATDAMAVEGRFACAFWAEEKDFPKLAQALEA